MLATGDFDTAAEIGKSVAKELPGLVAEAAAAALNATKAAMHTEL